VAHVLGIFYIVGQVNLSIFEIMLLHYAKTRTCFLWWSFMLIGVNASNADYNIFSRDFVNKCKATTYHYFIFFQCILLFEDVVFCTSLLLLVSEAFQLVMH